MNALSKLANRLNAQKSTGPRTAAGKTRASLNALKHGATAQTIILPGEDSKSFESFHRSFLNDLRPMGALEESMVQELAQIQWAVARVRGHESTLFALGHEDHAEKFNTGGDQRIQTAFAGATTLKAESDTIKNLSLYLQRHNRMFLATLKALREIQAERRDREKKDFNEALSHALRRLRQDKPPNLKEFGFDFSLEQLQPYINRVLSERMPKQPPQEEPDAA